MENICILDCTLRDGGYVNQWKFGYYQKKVITKKLVYSSVEIIECGFLTEKKAVNEELTLYRDVREVNQTLPDSMNDTMAVCMINYGEYNVDNLQECTGSGVTGIRVAFHKKDLDEVFDFCKRIKEKGYKVFVQPMVSLNYTDAEFVCMIEKFNEIDPYAFYIVDSFGMMQRKDILRLFYLIDNNLKQSVKMGFHSHNNLQMAFLNAQALIDIQSTRNLIVDSSIHGMGRGAGNLNTELLMHFLNINYDKKYGIKHILYVVDEVISKIYMNKYWGYSIPNYLSAINNCHPNYATYLDDKKTLTVDDMNNIFNSLDEEVKKEFDKKYIEQKYIEYLSGEKRNINNLCLEKYFKDKDILVIAAGKSAKYERDTVKRYLTDDSIISISVNCVYEFGETDYIFIGNRRRYVELFEGGVDLKKIIVTSNIDCEENVCKIDYHTLLNDDDVVCDNSGLMLLKFLLSMGVNNIYLAGMDGYSYDMENNYASERMETHLSKEYVDKMNEGMKHVIDEYRKKGKIKFVTTTNLT